MKKYSQAILTVTAIVSLVSLLIYRHEYNKLRYVLEVFSYFGKPNQKDVETNCSNILPVLPMFDMKFEEPVSSWQKLDDSLYVYSAYSIREKEVQALAFGSLDSIKNMQCKIFFENELNPYLGRFRYNPIDDNIDSTQTETKLKYNGYHFLCAYTQNKIPVGIAFLTDSNANVKNAPILSIKSQPLSLNATEVGICVIPPLKKPIYSSEMFGFISFHVLIGMDNFIVYDFGIPNNFNSYMKELSRTKNPEWKFSYTIIPWNFPFINTDYKKIKNVIEADCLYRTFNKLKYVTTMSWEEYVVLKYHYYLTDLIADFKRSRLKADRYKLTTLTFCTEQPDTSHVTNLSLAIFRNTRFNPNGADNYPLYIHSSHKVLKKTGIYTREISKDLALLNRYKYCYEKPIPEGSAHDSSILRFTENIYNLGLFKKFMADGKFLLQEQ